MLPSDTAQPRRPQPHPFHGLVEDAGHAVGIVVGEPGEQRHAGRQLHAALGIERPHLDQAGADAAGQGPDERPQHRPLARPGRPGDEHVRAGQPQPVRLSVLPHPERQPAEVGHVRHGQRRDHGRQGVAAHEADHHPIRAIGGPGLAGVLAEGVGEAFRGLAPVVGDLARKHPHGQLIAPPVTAHLAPVGARTGHHRTPSPAHR